MATPKPSAPPQPESAAVGGDRWRRNFQLLLVGSAASLLGSMSLSVATPIIALRQSGGPVLAAWVAAAATLPNLLCHLPAGLLVDRWDRRRIMLVCQAARTLSSLSAALLFANGEYRPWLLLVVAVVNGTCSAFYNVAEIAILPQLLPRAEIVRGMAANEMRVNSALLLGRPLGGALVAAGPAAVYACDALLGLVALVTQSGVCASPTQHPESVRPPQRVRPTWRSGALRELAEALAWLRRYRFVRSALVVVTVTNALFQIVVLLLIVRAGQQGVPTPLVGVLLAAPAIGGWLVSGYAAATRSARRPSRWRLLSQPRSPLTLLRVVLLIWFAATTLLAVSSSLVVWTLGWGAIGLMGTWLNIIRAGYIADRAPPVLRGRVTGVTRFLTQGAAPLGTLGGGYLISAAGCRPVAWSVAATIAALGAMLWAARRLAVATVLRRRRRHRLRTA